MTASPGAASGRCNGCSTTSPVDRRWCLIHATHATTEEISQLAQSGAVAGLCPVTEANLGDGTFNAAEFCGRGGAFGIGSDSNVLIGVSDELRQLEYSQRLAHQGAQCRGRDDGLDRPRAVRRRGHAADRRRLALRRRGWSRVVLPISSVLTPGMLVSRGGPATPCSTAGFLAQAVHWSIASGRAAARSCAAVVTMRAKRSRSVFLTNFMDCWPHET